MYWIESTLPAILSLRPTSLVSFLYEESSWEEGDFSPSPEQSFGLAGRPGYNMYSLIRDILAS